MVINLSFYHSYKFLKIFDFRIGPFLWKGDEDFYHYEMLADVTFNLNIEMDINDPAENDNYYKFGYIGYSCPNNDGSPTLSMVQFEYDSEPIFKEHLCITHTLD